MAKQYLKDSDSAATYSSLNRAVELINEAINRDDYDHGTIKRLCELLVVANNYAKKSNNLNIVKDILSIINANKCKFTVNEIDTLKAGLNTFVHYFPEDYKHDIAHVLQTITSEYITDETDRIFGTIDKVNSTERGVSYGFVCGLDGQRYFFHRTELHPMTMLDQDYYNKNVSFIASKNIKGICAIEIKEA